MSIRNDLDVDFKFPEPQKLTIRLKDVLEPQVDEKYYLSDEQTKRLKMTTYTMSIAATLSTMQGGNQEPTIVASRGRGEHNMQHLEPRKDSLTNTITSVQKDNYVANSLRIRKLTPKECWRLMGFDDTDFDKAQAAGVSNTQLYKQAGNSIVVDCLEGILNNLLIENAEE